MENKIDCFKTDIMSRNNISEETYNQIKQNIKQKCLSGNTKSYRSKIEGIYNSYFSEDAKKIINFDNNFFGDLVKTRNGIAHSNLFNEFYTKYDFLYNKTLLYICYLIWRDIGLEDKDIFLVLNPHTRFIRYLNEKELNEFKNRTIKK